MWTDNKQGVKCLETRFEGVETCTVGKRYNVCYKQLFSRYYFTGMHSALLDLPKDVSILYIGYDLGDMQFTVTGTCRYGEDEETAAAREIMEEVGIDFDASKLMLHSYGTIEKQDAKSAVFSLCIDNCKVKRLDELPIVFSGRRARDDRNRKVSVIIYGSRENLRDVMEMARPLCKDERINYYGSVPYASTKLLVDTFKHVFLHGLQIEGYNEEEEKKRKKLSMIKIVVKRRKITKTVQNIDLSLQ